MQTDRRHGSTATGEQTARLGLLWTTPTTASPLATTAEAGCEHGRGWSFCRHRRPSRGGASPLPAVPPRGPTCPSAHATQPASAPSPSQFCDRTGRTGRTGRTAQHSTALTPTVRPPSLCCSGGETNRRGHSSPPKLQPRRAIRTLLLHVPLSPPITPIHAPFLHTRASPLHPSVAAHAPLPASSRRLRLCHCHTLLAPCLSCRGPSRRSPVTVVPRQTIRPWPFIPAVSILGPSRQPSDKARIARVSHRNHATVARARTPIRCRSRVSATLGTLNPLHPVHKHSLVPAFSIDVPVPTTPIRGRRDPVSMPSSSDTTEG
ncbi:hypothetical protein PSV08DRAFT_401355 [Bipolaris maydis]|uniref:uncharacterized protein n=1 Tax=Cochliobolus heterostrophus TaxID=5016 RepID=UPI0024DB267D|nr:hypothetical protein PSV08DRAFT_401355 [Bipolaris maydis]